MRKSLWPCGGFCGFTAELIVWKDQCIELAVKKNEISNWKWRGKWRINPIFTHRVWTEDLSTMPRRGTTISWRAKMLRPLNFASYQRLVLERKSPHPLPGPSSQPWPEFRLGMVPQSLSHVSDQPSPTCEHTECGTKEEAAAWGFLCCRRGQSELKTVGNLNLVPVHSDVKPQEIKAESGDLWKNGRSHYYVCSIDWRRSCCPQIKMAFTCLGPSWQKHFPLCWRGHVAMEMQGWMLGKSTFR